MIGVTNRRRLIYNRSDIVNETRSGVCRTGGAASSVANELFVGTAEERRVKLSGEESSRGGRKLAGIRSTRLQREGDRGSRLMAGGWIGAEDIPKVRGPRRSTERKPGSYGTSGRARISLPRFVLDVWKAVTRVLLSSPLSSFSAGRSSPGIPPRSLSRWLSSQSEIDRPLSRVY